MYKYTNFENHPNFPYFKIFPLLCSSLARLTGAVVDRQIANIVTENRPPYVESLSSLELRSNNKAKAYALCRLHHYASKTGRFGFVGTESNRHRNGRCPIARPVRSDKRIYDG